MPRLLLAETQTRCGKFVLNTHLCLKVLFFNRLFFASALAGHVLFFHRLSIGLQHGVTFCTELHVGALSFGARRQPLLEPAPLQDLAYREKIKEPWCYKAV